MAAPNCNCSFCTLNNPHLWRSVLLICKAHITNHGRLNDLYRQLELRPDLQPWISQKCAYFTMTDYFHQQGYLSSGSDFDSEDNLA